MEKSGNDVKVSQEAENASGDTHAISSEQLDDIVKRYFNRFQDGRSRSNLVKLIRQEQ